jgi:hypothetical protein
MHDVEAAIVQNFAAVFDRTVVETTAAGLGTPATNQ